MNTIKRILKGILKFCGICLLIFLAMCAYSIIKYSGKYRNKAAASSVSVASSVAASESVSSSAAPGKHCRLSFRCRIGSGVLHARRKRSHNKPHR